MIGASESDHEETTAPQPSVDGSSNTEKDGFSPDQTSQDPEDTGEESALHDKVLSESTKLMQKVVLYAIFQSFMYASRTNIQVLYARTFYDNTSLVSWIIFIGEISFGVIALFITSLADRFGFDGLLVVTVAITWIGIVLEATAWNFSAWAIGQIISRQPNMYLILAYVASSLPVTQSKQYTARFYQIYAIAYLLGPVFSGVLTHFTSYRVVFIVNAAVVGLSVIYILFYVWRTQKPLQKKQLTLIKPLYDRHPISDSDDATESTESTVVANTMWTVSEDYRFPVCVIEDENRIQAGSSTSCYQWFVVTNVLVQNSLTFGNEAAVTTWYTVYMSDKYNSNIILSTSQLVCVCLFLVAGMELMKVIGKKVQKWRDQKTDSGSASKTTDDSDLPDIKNMSFSQLHAHNRYDLCNVKVMICIVSYLVCMLLLFVAYPDNILDPVNEQSYVGTFWVYGACYGFVWGLLSMAQELIVIEAQPKHLVGRVNGIKGFARSVCKAVLVVAVGLLWHHSYEWLWYIQGISLATGFFLMLSLIFAEYTSGV